MAGGSSRSRSRSPEPPARRRVERAAGPAEPRFEPGPDAGDEDQQREAEELVTITLERLPQFTDPEYAYAQGYRSIRDAATGHEHFMKWELIDDGRMLDPDHPESLVYEVDRETGEKRLAAAMFMANRGDTLDSVPDIGGPLVHMGRRTSHRGRGPYYLYFSGIGLGFLIWGEVPAWTTLGGAAVVIGAGLYNVHRERVRRAAERRAGAG